MASIGFTSAGLVVARRLCMFTAGTVAHGTRWNKVRSLVVELIIGLGPPFAQLVICAYIWPF